MQGDTLEINVVDQLTDGRMNKTTSVVSSPAVYAVYKLTISPALALAWVSLGIFLSMSPGSYGFYVSAFLRKVPTGLMVPLL